MNHELETLKTKLEEKEAAYVSLLEASHAQQKRISKYESDLKQLSEDNNQLIQELKESKRGDCYSLPPMTKLNLITACIGLMRDRMTGNIMSDKEFEAYAEGFVNQAQILADMVYVRCMAPAIDSSLTSMTNQELAT